jgi:hypothetical protein|tara:strand:+ start:2434 stop:2937 length:504 start_codon:yes stop_codon:yes gene_type:complete
MNKFDDLRNKSYLEIIGIYLKEFKPIFLEKNEDRPLDVLVVSFIVNSSNRNMTLTFLPNVESLLKYSQLLQFFSPLPGLKYLGADKEINKLIVFINSQLPIGNFSYNNNGEVFWKYSHLIPTEKLSAEKQFSDLFLCSFQIINMFGEELRMAISGEKNVSEVMKAFG